METLYEILIFIQLGLIALKWYNYIHCSWKIVFIPFYIMVGIVVFIKIAAYLIDKQEGRR